MLLFSVSCLSTQAVYEEPHYTVLHSFDNIEIRKYKESLVAEVFMGGSRRDSSYKAFRVLADFISGKNKNTQNNDQPVQIKMTQPVFQQQQKKKWKTSFFMPRKWTLKTLPSPQNKKVKIRRLPKRNIAVIQFSGAWTNKNIISHQKQLESYLAKNKYKRKGSPIIAYYNSPFVPWFMRRNEVMYIISK